MRARALFTQVLVVLCLCWIQTDADEEHAMPSGTMEAELMDCMGTGQSSCKRGEFCRNGRCARVQLLPSGCEETEDCKEGYECYARRCIIQAADEDYILLEQKERKLGEILEKNNRQKQEL